LFTHLHVHTEYSLLDGLCRIEPMVQRAKELGMEAMAITDHGGLYGAIDFYQAARAAGIKPIIGCEMYVAQASRHARTSEAKNPYHLTMLARNEKGYKNLVKLVTKAHLEGFYYRPRVDRELLEQYHEGLIVLSGCPSGEVPQLAASGRMEEAKAAATWYRERFDGYYLEVMRHGGVPELPAINEGLMRLHKETKLPLVATNDAHYVRREDAGLQDILICIHTNTNILDEKRLRMEEDSYYLKSPQEMAELYADLPDAVRNTQAIADMCDITLDLSQRLPEYPVPAGMSADEYLSKLCWDGLRRRLARATTEEEKRLTYELQVIKQTRFANYFLVVWDIARFVRERKIYFAVRGSAAASLVLYCLGVTDVNPLPYRLVFERFLNVERREMPDIDMDFQDDRRDEVINYVTAKYGRDHVAQIITFGTLGARASIRDVGRALAMPYADVDRVAKLVPFRLHITLDDAIASTPELAEMYQADEIIRKLVDTARGLEGLVRHSSTHAAGVVISKEPLDEYVPLQRPVKGDDQSVTMTQYAMDPIATLGLLKMDFLGLANLTILAKALRLIEKTRGVQLNLRDIPLDDARTFEMLSRGETAGVFQIEGAGMTRHIKELKPNSLGDLVAMVALYRPGPMEHIPTFINAKHGRTAPHSIHPALTEILEETYGVIVYQDQVLHIVRAFAGYSLGEADKVRKAMGKKIPEIMAAEREKFIKGALKQGYDQEVAERVFSLIEPFAGYAFNKAHSVSYALISYWTAYLKANYTGEYMVSLLNAYVGNADKVTSVVAECGRLRIPVLLPDINGSEAVFSLETQDGKSAIRFGLATVKNVGESAVGPVIEARAQKGPFPALEYACRDANLGLVNRKALESLIKAGAFDRFGDRGALLAVLDRILGLAQSEARLRASGQSSMFDLFGESVPTPLATIALPPDKTPQRQMGEWEVELLGVDLSSGHSLTRLAAQLKSGTILSRADVQPEMAGERVTLAGAVRQATHRFTRDNKPYCIATVGLLDGSLDVWVWQNVLDQTPDLWREGKLVELVGTVRVREDDVTISCLSASEHFVGADGEAVAPVAGQPIASTPKPQAMPDTKPIRHVAERSEDSKAYRATNGGTKASASPGNGAPPPMRRLRLRIQETGEEERDREMLERVKNTLLDFQGQDEVGLEIAIEGRIIALDWTRIQVNACDDLQERLRALLGDAGQVAVETRQR
jgi:DNA polymerase-3 subunit alpha